MGVCLGSKTTSIQREINYTNNEINNKPQSNIDEIENDNTKASLNEHNNELYFHQISSQPTLNNLSDNKYIHSSSLDSIVLIQKPVPKGEEDLSPIDPPSHPIKKKIICFSDTYLHRPLFSGKDLNNGDIINVLILGGKGVGKSAFMLKLTKNYFEKYYIPTVMTETRHKRITFNGKQYNFRFIIPPLIQEKKKDEYNSIFENAKVIFLFYDTTVKGSFEEAKNLLYTSIDNYSHLFTDGIPLIAFIGNKIDLPNRKEPKEDIESFCSSNQFKFFEISVKTGNGVLSLLNTIISKCE